MFLKGIIVGIGGVVPGLSGCVLLMIFGLYQKTLDALGSIFKDCKKKLAFLLPLVLGMFAGVILFGKIIDFLLANYEMPTRYCFLGLILGTVPMVFRNTKKEGFGLKYYGVILVSAVLGGLLLGQDAALFPRVDDPNLLQCIALGVAVAATAIIPGVEPAVLLSALGFYEMYVGALARVDLQILLPMVIGLAAGAVVISYGMTLLFRHFYTTTYCVFFGLFIVMIPSILTEACVLSMNGESVVSVLLLLLGLAVSVYLGDIQGNNRKIRSWLIR